MLKLYYSLNTLLDYLLTTRNPNNGVDGGSIPTSHEKFLYSENVLKVKLEVVPIVSFFPLTGGCSEGLDVFGLFFEPIE